MNIEHIFEFDAGHPISTIIGWIILLVSSIWIGLLLPYAYHGWVINRKINIENLNVDDTERRYASIEHLKNYHNTLTEYASLDARKRISDNSCEFGKQVIGVSWILVGVMVIGIFFPTIASVFIWILEMTM